MRTSTIFALLIIGVAWSQEAGTDAKLLQGKWMPLTAEIAGAKFPEAELAKISLQLADGKYTVEVGKAIDKGTWKIDAASKPKTMDIVGTEGPNKGRTMLAIYELKDDTLRICYDLEGKNRPTEFATSKEKPFFLATYRRAK